MISTRVPSVISLAIHSLKLYIIAQENMSGSAIHTGWVDSDDRVSADPSTRVPDFNRHSGTQVPRYPVVYMSLVRYPSPYLLEICALETLEAFSKVVVRRAPGGYDEGHRTGGK